MAVNNTVDLIAHSGQMQLWSILSLIIIGLFPLIFLSTTSYIKVSVVFTILRSALGGGQIPSQAICGILSLIISLYTISPVMERVLESFESSDKMNYVERFTFVSKPIIKFVGENVNERERLYFYILENSRKSQDKQRQKCNELISEEIANCLSANESPASLILAFISSELRSACLVGVYLFIPFLIIDLIVSTLLTGLGMMMVSPVTITLPIKLLVFVLSDGWRLLIQNLIISYKV